MYRIIFLRIAVSVYLHVQLYVQNYIRRVIHVANTHYMLLTSTKKYISRSCEDGSLGNKKSHIFSLICIPCRSYLKHRWRPTGDSVHCRFQTGLIQRFPYEVVPQVSGVFTGRGFCCEIAVYSSIFKQCDNRY